MMVPSQNKGHNLWVLSIKNDAEEVAWCDGCAMLLWENDNDDYTSKSMCILINMCVEQKKGKSKTFAITKKKTFNLDRKYK